MQISKESPWKVLRSTKKLREVERSTPHVSSSAVSPASSRDMMTTQEAAASPRRLDIIMMRRIVKMPLCLHSSFIVPFTITQMAIQLLYSTCNAHSCGKKSTRIRSMISLISISISTAKGTFDFIHGISLPNFSYLTWKRLLWVISSNIK